MDARNPSHAASLPRRALLGAGLAGLGAAAGCRSASARPEPTDPAVDELLAQLTDRTADVEPIAPVEHRARRSRLAGLLSDAGTNALLVEPGATMTYLTGVSWGLSERLFALVALADDTAFVVCPAFERERAHERLSAAEALGIGVVTWHEHEYASAPLAAALRERAVETVAVEPRCRFFVADRLGEAFGRERLRSGEELLVALRGRKDAHELALLRRANELTQEAIVAASEHVREGMTGTEIAALVRRAQERLGLTGVWVLALVGPAAALPHGSAKEVPLQRGDVILVDTGGSYHGYQSDITRTWVFGAPPEADVERAWTTVRDAQARAFDAIAPGVPGREADRAARAVMDAAGYGSGYDYFTHRLGHGIGLEGHEEPYLDGGNARPLAPGMTFSDEPGIYVWRRFGVRLEDIVVVTEDGADHFGDWQASPASPRSA